VLFAVHDIPGYFIALAAGVLVGAAAVVVLKSIGPADIESSEAELAHV
jgi:PTS system fructose-specific IIC component